MWAILIFFALGVGAAVMRRPNPAIHRVADLVHGRRYLLRLQNLQPSQVLGPYEVETAVRQGMSDPNGAAFVSAEAQPGNAIWNVVFDWRGATGEYFVWDSGYVIADIGSSFLANGGAQVPPPMHTGLEPDVPAEG